MNCKCGKPIHSKGLCTTCCSREWRKNNPEKYKAGAEDWYARNREHTINKAKKWNKENPDKANAATRKYVKKSNYYKERYHTDIEFRLRVILRNRLLQSVRTNARAGSAVKDLGCTVSEFKEYLESRFTSGMTWDNMGDWHIDHIKPLVNFDLTNVEQFKEACHYTNLQPLCKEDNLKKSDTV